MVTINNVDFDGIIDEAIRAAKFVAIDNWDEARDIVENIARELAGPVTAAFRERKVLPRPGWMIPPFTQLKGWKKL